MLERIIIYPKGKVGEDIVYLLKFMGVKNEQILFIDDSSSFCLQDYCKIKKAQDVVCIASRRYFFDIAKKLDAFDIPYCDGMSFIAKRLDEYFMQRKPPYSTVGVITSGPSGSKHRGRIEDILRSNGFEVVFLCANDQEMTNARERIKDSIAIVLNEKEILKRITFASVIISEGGELFHPNVTGVYIPHTIAFPADGLVRQMLITNIMMDRVIENNEFIATPGKTMHRLWDSYIDHTYLKNVGTMDGFKKYSFSYKIKPLGMPTLDRYSDKQIEIGESTLDRVFVCLNADTTTVKHATSLVLGLLKKGFEVLYRPHPLQRMTHLHQSIKTLFCENPKFVFDTSLKISLDIIKKRILMIVDVSSLAYSYPIATQTPVVVYVDEVWKKRLTDVESISAGGGDFMRKEFIKLPKLQKRSCYV